MSDGKIPMLAGVASLALTLGGCATMATRADGSNVNAPEANANTGIAYFLPRQLATVTVKRTESRIAKASKKVVDAQAGLTEAQTDLDAKTVTEATARDAYLGHDKDDPARDLLRISYARAQAALELARDGVKAQQGKLLAANTAFQTEVTAAHSSVAGDYDVTVDLALLPVSADPTKLFRLNPRHAASRDDEHKLKVGTNGLLASEDVVASDRTADILVELATFSGALSGLIKTGGDARSGEPGMMSVPCSKAPDEIVAVVDLANGGDLDELNRQLTCHGVRLTPEESVNWATAGAPAPDRRRDIDGIVYRTPADVRLRIEKCIGIPEAPAPAALPQPQAQDSGPCPGGRWLVTRTVQVSLPQAGPISVVRQDAGLFTRTTYGLAFDQGMLTSYSASRPSEVLEAARTPLRVVNGVFDGISKVISLRTGQANGLSGLSTAQLAALSAQNKLALGPMANEQARVDAQLALAQAQSRLLLQPAGAEKDALEAQLNLLKAYYALQAGTPTGESSLTQAQLTLLQQQLAFQNAGLTGQTQAAASQQALLNALTQLSIANRAAPAQLAAADLTAQISELSTRAKQDALNHCVGRAVATAPAGTVPDISGCLPTP
jgi:hypothetical protein